MHSLSSSRGKSAINWNGADNGLSTGLLQCDNVHLLPYEEIDCVGNGTALLPPLSGFHINVRKRTEQVPLRVHHARSITIPAKWVVNSVHSLKGITMAANNEDKNDNRSTVGGPAHQKGKPANEFAESLGMRSVPPAQPKALAEAAEPEVTLSPALSLFARPGDRSIQARRIAIMVADGVDGASARAVRAGLAAKGAVPRFVGARLGAVESMDGNQVEVDVTFEAMPAVLFDALVVPGGHEDALKLACMGHAVEFIKEQYRHCKPILALGYGQGFDRKRGREIESGLG